MTSTITLTRAEAYAISAGMHYTSGAGTCDDFSAREDCYGAIHALQLEAAIRDAGDWWDEGDPGSLHTLEYASGSPCPEHFRLAVEGLPAILELLPDLLAYAEHTIKLNRIDRDRCESSGRCGEEYAEQCVIWEGCRDALLGLPARLGIDVGQPVA